MSRLRYTLDKEPQGQLYRDLIDYLQGRSSRFSLVLRPDLPLDEEAKKVLRVLSPWLLDRKEVQEWAGTRLLSGAANLFTFHSTPEAAAVLQSKAGSLFEWKQPRLPEDLTFYDARERPWLVTISHEEDAFVELDGPGLLELHRSLPGLLLRRQA